MKRCSDRTSRATTALITVAFLVLAFCASCGKGGAPASTARAVKPARIISLTPSTTEILYGVGAFDRVVAVSDYCTYPPEANRLPRVGGWNNPNMEQIASLRPDLVVFSDAQAQFVKDKLEAAGIRTLSVPSQTLEDAYASIELVGRATGDEEAATKLLKQTRDSVETVRLAAERLPRRRVLCVVDRVPGTLRDLYTAGEGSFIAQLIRIAGGDPVTPPGAERWGKIQKEAVVALDPDVVLDLMMHKEAGSYDEDTLAVWRELPTLRAVREARIYPVRDETVLHPSQLVADSAHKFAELIHPEAFAKK
ncbi:MAG: cobalamin transport system substrate-binding protein [Acidobacteriota bacterium]|jgi:iron complex transport system substrate-binding protein|nr:cobalamin transport system substrate-binding protein [Acidobacteriota bacterium]